MKKFFLLSLFALLCGFGFAQNNNPQPNDENLDGPKIQFQALEHNYGTIQKGSDGTCTFTFTNTGNEPLVLSNVKASCGCTTPKWTQKPVMPGQTGNIDVRYNTNNVGGFNKSITVTSNAVDNPRIVLKIKGNVQKPDQQNN